MNQQKKSFTALPAGGPDTLRIEYDNLAPATESPRVTFMAHSGGSSDYRYTEQVGMMPRSFEGLAKGKQQTITFPRGQSPVSSFNRKPESAAAM